MLLVVMVLFLIMAPSAFAAGWNVTVSWTPSDNAVSESLFVGVFEQACPQAGTCTFIVAVLTAQPVFVRSYNSQGRYVEYEVGTLIEADLPNPASDALIIIRSRP